MNKRRTSDGRILTISPSRKEYLVKRKRNAVTVIFFRAFVLIATVLLWELFARTGIIDAFVFSSPTRVAKTLVDLYVDGELLVHCGTTLFETLSGFILATFFGCAFSVLLWCFETLRKISEPYVVVLNALPKIALGPIIIIVFGAGTASIVFMTFLVTVIVTTINMLNGFLQTDRGKILLLKSMGANKFDLLFRLVLPGALPAFVSALKVNVGLSWIGSIMGEYVVSKQGIGYLIVYGGQVFKLDLVMAGTVLLCIFAAAMYALVLLFERLTVKRKR